MSDTQAAPREAVAQEDLPPPGSGGAGSGGRFVLDPAALGRGGATGVAGVDVGSESAPPPVGGRTVVTPAPGGAKPGGATPGGSGAVGFDAGGEVGPGVTTPGFVPPPPPVPPSPVVPPLGTTGGGAGGASVPAGAPPPLPPGAVSGATGGRSGPVEVGAESGPGAAAPATPSPFGGGTPPAAGRQDASAIVEGMERARATGTDGGTQVAANDAASSFGNTAPPPLDPNRPFVVDERYDRVLARVEQTPVPAGGAQAPAPVLPEPEGAYQDGPGKLVRRIAAARPEDEARLRQDIRELYLKPGAVATGNKLQTALSDVLAAGDNPAYRQEVLNGIASIAKVDPLQLAAEDMSVPGLVLGGVAATPGKLAGVAEAGAAKGAANAAGEAAAGTGGAGNAAKPAATLGGAGAADEGAGLAGGAAKPGEVASTIGTPAGGAPRSGGVTGTGVGAAEGAANTQRQTYLDTLRASHPKEIDSVSTFVTHGVSDSEAARFLATPEGERFLTELRVADAKASSDVIVNRAIEQIQSGASVPRMETAPSSLVKIVPEGQAVSRYSPYFTTIDELNKAISSGVSLGEYFGLPIKSQASVYDVYQITPLTATNVFTIRVAPTTELGGLVKQSGSGTQIIVPNRSNFSDPAHIGKISN